MATPKAYEPLTKTDVLVRVQDAINYLILEKKVELLIDEGEYLGYLIRGLIDAKRMLKEATA